MSGKEAPYKSLGSQLKALRERAGESLAEASGAVEIDVKQLASFELGQNCPSEDVLLLLISHFEARDEDAVRMWELAGYGNARPHLEQPSNETNQVPAGQILFTDVVDVTVNNYGVVMNFMQGAGPNSAPASIAKVGMSREHAKSVLQILQLTLSQTENNTKNQKTTSPGPQAENKNNH